MFGYGVSPTVSTVCFLLGIIGGLFLFFGFLPKKKEGEYSGFLAWLYSFLNFKTMMAETILRILYLITACVVTFYALGALLFTRNSTVGENLLSFLLILVLGNVIVRLIYELTLITLVICRNTTEINTKLQCRAEPNAPLDPPLPPPAPAAKEVCANCQADLPKGAAFCPGCGTAK